MRVSKPSIPEAGICGRHLQKVCSEELLDKNCPFKVKVFKTPIIYH